MKYLLLPILAPVAIYGSQLIGTKVTGLTACLILALLFCLLCCAVVFAIVLNGRSKRPACPKYVIGWDTAKGDSRSVTTLLHLKDGKLYPCHQDYAQPLPANISAAYRQEFSRMHTDAFRSSSPEN